MIKKLLLFDKDTPLRALLQIINAKAYQKFMHLRFRCFQRAPIIQRRERL